MPFKGSPDNLHDKIDAQSNLDFEDTRLYKAMIDDGVDPEAIASVAGAVKSGTIYKDERGGIHDPNIYRQKAIDNDLLRQAISAIKSLQDEVAYLKPLANAYLTIERISKQTDPSRNLSSSTVPHTYYVLNQLERAIKDEIPPSDTSRSTSPVL